MPIHNISANAALSPLEPGTVRCFGVDLRHEPEAWRALCVPWTTQKEQRQAAAFVHAADATRHLLGRTLLRVVASRLWGRCPEELSANAWGKPHWPDSGLEFNIGHSGKAVWLAVCRDAPVGIDVEQLSACSDPREMSRLLHPNERSAIEGASGKGAQATTFLRCWTRKEAVIKALGEGLYHPLDSFEVACDAAPRNWLRTQPLGNRSGWTCSDLGGDPEYSVSIAATAPGLAITFHRLEGLLEGLPPGLSKTMLNKW